MIQEANDLNFDAAKRQLQIYLELNVLPENVQAALDAFVQAAQVHETTQCHYLLFTGHMIDQPDRKEPRFPAEKEPAARAAIKNAVQQEVAKTQGPITGIAGGACGGDILFHEVCEELGIPSVLYLALPRDQFLVESVQFAGPAWVERFDRLYKKLPVKVLAQTKELPLWLQSKPQYTIWERNNQWMLYAALDCGGLQMSLIALWDGKRGDGPGGTAHMVEVAQRRGRKPLSWTLKFCDAQASEGKEKLYRSCSPVHDPFPGKPLYRIIAVYVKNYVSFVRIRTFAFTCKNTTLLPLRDLRL